MKVPKRIFASTIIATMLAQGGVLAQSFGEVPECQFAGMPSSEQVSACQAAALRLGQNTQAVLPPKLSTTGLAQGVPSLPGLDMSKFPKLPMISEGGPMPEFMGRPLVGGGVDAMTGQIGAGLEQIQSGLLRAEDGIKELKNGQIKIDQSTEQSVKESRL